MPVDRRRRQSDGRSASGGASKLTTWPHAWTPASVRPAHVRSSISIGARSDLLERVDEHALDRALLALRGEAVEVGAVVRDDELQTLRGRGTPSGRRRLLDERHAAGSTDQLDARHRRVVTRTRTELQDAQVATGAVGVARRDLGEELVRDLLVVDRRDDLAAVVHATLLGLA